MLIAEATCIRLKLKQKKRKYDAVQYSVFKYHYDIGFLDCGTNRFVHGSSQLTERRLDQKTYLKTPLKSVLCIIRTADPLSNAYSDLGIAGHTYPLMTKKGSK